MTDYGGVYRATCRSVSSDHITATVPQLYGVNAISIYSFAGAMPAVNNTGWVGFENERPEHPVWIGTGATGGGGGPSAPPYFRWVQTTPASTWTIPHNMGFYPNVSIVDSSHREVIGEVTYTDINTVTVTFQAGGVPAAFGGEAYCS